MKCPMPLVVMFHGDYPPDLCWRDCLKEECAWWEAHTHSCTIPAYFKVLHALWERLNDIEKKMPHAEQFTK